MARTMQIGGKPPAKRKVITPSKTTVRFLVPSPKNGGQCYERESTVENDLLLLSEFSRGVKRVQEHVKKEIVWGGMSFTTYIDFEFELTDGSLEYHEVKYDSKTRDPETAERLAATREFLAREGHPFFVDTEITLRQCPQMLSNLMILRRFKYNNPEFVASLHKCIPAQLSTVEQLVADVGDNAMAVAMIAWQFVYCDLNLPLNNQTRVRHIEENDHAFLYR